MYPLSRIKDKYLIDGCLTKETSENRDPFPQLCKQPDRNLTECGRVRKIQHSAIPRAPIEVNNSHFRPEVPTKLSTIRQVSDIQMIADKIINEIDQRIPKINVTNISHTSSAIHSRVYLKNPKDSYCVGDHLTVQVDMCNYWGKKKTYGGDFLRARIYTPELEAGSSGRIEDLYNGSYHVHFILFWEGKVNIELFLIHPSEGVSALWTYRNRWHGYLDHMGKFVKGKVQKEVMCGYDLDIKQELCKYKDVRDEEYYYCIKPPNFSCDDLLEVKMSWRYGKTFFTTVEKSLLDKSNIRVKIPTDFPPINVLRCSQDNTPIKEKCKIGMKLNYPSGYAMKNVWYPHGCSLLTYESLVDLNKCLKKRFIHLFGDSTIRQYFYYMENKIKTLETFFNQQGYWFRLNTVNNMTLIWSGHTLPFHSFSYDPRKDVRTVAHKIDLIMADNRTAIVLNIGIHLRCYPIYYFIRRLYNIRRAIERLLFRSPEAKVIIKTENTSAMDKNNESYSDFHASIHYIIMEIIFKDLNVGFVNGWDMTNAFDTNDMHPPEKVIGNEVKMVMTYIC
ncbi:NXPE family member 4-like [Leptodactylus fuscus]|uniref:NXPE family member 4-like n=1 Tax=Leptodactylus fuscus TaxID=238119 RepID=UPI003F4E6BA5